MTLLLAGGALGTASAPASASEPPNPTVAVSLDAADGSVSDLVVDDARQVVLLACGNGVLETLDYTGQTVDAEYLPGVGALALDPATGHVYATQESEHAIAVATADGVQNSIDLGSGVTPLTVAYGDGRVWFGYRSADGTVGVGSLDPTAAPAAVDLHAVPGVWSQVPQLAADDSRLVAAAGGTVSVLSLDAGHAEARASRTVSATGDVRQALLSPDGTAVLLPGLTGDTAAALSTDDLSSLGEYSGAAASAAVAADGSVVTASGAQVTLHRPGSFDADRTWNLGAPTVGLHNLAWTRDRSHLFAVTADPATGLGITLHLGFDPDLTPSQLTVSAVGNPPTVQGRLTAGGVPVTGAKVRIRRGTTQVLAEPTLDSDGRFSFTDEALTPGDYTYTADFGGSDTLQPTVARSTTTVPPISSSIAYTKVPGQVLGGQAVQLQGTFAVAAGGYDPDRAAIASWVTGPDAPGGREAATQHSGNTFEVLDTPAKPGVYTYTTWYQGDGTDAYVGGSKTTATVTVVRLATTLTLRQSTTSTVVGSAVTVHGTVALAGAPYEDGAWVHVLRYSPAHPSGEALPDLWTTAAKGWSFDLTDRPESIGAYRYHFSFPGSARHEPATADAVLAATGRDPGLTLNTDATRYGYGSRGTVTVGIGRHYTGTVSIWAQPSGGARVLLRKVYLSNDASLAIPYTFTRNTTFTAGYSGDTGYSAVSRIRTVTTSARLSTALRGWYTSSGSWRVYHRTAKKQLSVALAAPQPGKCVRVTVQQYVSGRWKTVRSTACARLASNSTLLWTVPFATPVGAKYRVAAASYAGPNPAAAGPWLYFTVRK